jgi:hypothetical protein
MLAPYARTDDTLPVEQGTEIILWGEESDRGKLRIDSSLLTQPETIIKTLIPQQVR